MSCAELKKAALSGDGVPALDHARECEECSLARASLVEITALVSELDPPALTEDRAEALRARVLAGARPVPARKRSRVAWLAASIAIASAAAAAALVVSQRPPVVHGTIEAVAGARFTHAPVARGEPEIVRVFDGTVSVDVTPLAKGERFLVKTHDAEIEVHGTRFDVVVEDDSLVRVWVREGVVEVRSAGAAPVLLRPGDAWTRPVVVAPPAPSEAPLPSAAPLAPALKKPRAQYLAPIPAHERAFRDAWAAFARGDMGSAADLFAQAEGSETLAEDACYGRAVALERGGQRAEAIVEMRRFLSRYPRAVRGDEVAVSLGKLLVEAGEIAEARKLLLRGSKSATPEIKRSATRTLDALGAPTYE